jgi:hypothetical protein
MTSETSKTLDREYLNQIVEWLDGKSDEIAMKCEASSDVEFFQVLADLRDYLEQQLASAFGVQQAKLLYVLLVASAVRARDELESGEKVPTKVGEKTIVTKFDPSGRISEFEKRDIIELVPV